MHGCAPAAGAPRVDRCPVADASVAGAVGPCDVLEDDDGGETVVPAADAERAALLVARAQAAYAAARYVDARDLFAQAVAADAGAADAFYGLGLCQAKLDEWQDAANAFEHALALQPSLSQAERALGVASYRLGTAALEAEDYEQAAMLLRRAAELDPAVAGRARYAAGLALQGAGKQEQARTEFQAAAASGDASAAAAASDALATGAVGPGAPARPWEITLTAGMQYDSNVILQPRGRSPPEIGDRGDGAGILAAGFRYDVLNHPKGLLRFEYGFSQTLHPNITDFDQRANLVQGTASYGFRRGLWGGVQGGYNHYVEGSDSYLQGYYVSPFVSVAQGNRGLTTILYTHAGMDYLDEPFDTDLDRDGPADSVGVNQRLFFGGEASYVTFGYEFLREDPDSSRGDDFVFGAHQAHTGVVFPAWWQTAVELLYVYTYYDYSERNSAVDFRRTRVDNQHRMYAAVSRGLTDHLSATLSYVATINPSNIALYDYRRNVVSLFFQFRY
jgi:tetratricopeptide (TPR) repeat protein